MTDQEHLSNAVVFAIIFPICFLLLCYLYNKHVDKKIKQVQPESDKHLEFMDSRDRHVTKIRKA